MVQVTLTSLTNSKLIYNFFLPGIANYSTKPCPVGFYCLEATTLPTACPNGTYRDSHGARNITDCHLCPAGFYCPETNGSIYGESCPNGTFCPPGSTAPRECMQGYYCNRSMSQVPCPAGYFCPNASSQPVRCPSGHYCDPKLNCYSTNSTFYKAGACEAKLCPKGKYMAWLRVDKLGC